MTDTGPLAQHTTDTDTLAEALAAAMVREPMLLADAVCSIRHPDDRMGLTGFAAPDGNFYVSCATCKGDSYKVAGRLSDALAAHPVLAAHDVALRERAESAEGQVAAAHALADEWEAKARAAGRNADFKINWLAAARDLRAGLGDPATATTHNQTVAAQALRDAADANIPLPEWVRRWLRDRAAALDGSDT